MNKFKAPQRVWKSVRPIARPFGVYTPSLGFSTALFLPSLANATLEYNEITLEFLIIINLVSLLWFFMSYPMYYIWRNPRVIYGTSLILVGSLLIGLSSLYLFYPLMSGFIIWFVFYILTNEKLYDDQRFTDRPDSKFLGMNDFRRFWKL